VSVLAHVFEAAGIATVVLSSIREMVAKVAPPRALHCEFPLGRPLGKPADAAFQLDVITHALALLDAPSGPVLVDYPTSVVASDGDQPLACPLPARFDATIPAAVDEARGLRRAFDRSVRRRGVTNVGRVVGPDEVPTVVGLLQRIADGQDWTTVGLPGVPAAVCHDIRSYYDEAALELVDAVPEGRVLEDWFFSETHAGRTMLAARAAMREAGAKFPIWFYMVPGQR
jgi:hypothetical protein